MEVTIKFNLPKDHQQYIGATKGINYFTVLKEFDEQLDAFLEYDLDAKTIEYIKKHLHKIMEENQVSLKEI